MNKTLLLAVALSASASAMAYDYPYMSFETVAGSQKTVSVENLSITVSNGKLVATNAEGKEEFDLSQLASMQFAENMSSVETVISESEEVEAFTMLGVSCGKFANAVEAENNLRPGLYILKSVSKTIKIAVK